MLKAREGSKVDGMHNTSRPVLLVHHSPHGYYHSLSLVFGSRLMFTKRFYSYLIALICTNACSFLLVLANVMT